MSDAAGTGRAATVTTLLARVARGDRAAVSQLVDEVYDELRELARDRVGKLPAGQTLQTTDLVHEAWMRLAAGAGPGFEDRAHFFGAAANAMRNVLVDRARRKAALKRTLPGEAAHERAARIVLLRFFAGLTLPEVAELSGVSLATAERDWRFARSWLQREMGAS